jgi:hypothetical protein
MLSMLAVLSKMFCLLAMLDTRNIYGGWRGCLAMLSSGCVGYGVWLCWICLLAMLAAYASRLSCLCSLDILEMLADFEGCLCKLCLLAMLSNVLCSAA